MRWGKRNFEIGAPGSPDSARVGNDVKSESQEMSIDGHVGGKAGTLTLVGIIEVMVVDWKQRSPSDLSWSV